MPTINLRQTTKLKPEQYIAALTDFGPGRSKVFGNSADAYLKVRHNCPTLSMGNTYVDVCRSTWARSAKGNRQ
jgi:hypothetical protein